MMRVRKGLFLALGLGSAALACQLVAGIERVDKEPVPVTPVDAADTAPPPPPVDPCVHAVPPPRPTVDDAPTERLDDFFVAFRRVELVPEGNAPVRGFDLDGVCTCETAAGTAEGGAPSCAAKSPNCDLDGGVDNGTAAFLKTYAAVIDINESANINGQIQDGQRNAVVLISKYNGRANDLDVGFGLFSSEGIVDPSPCPGSTFVDGFYTPGWCGEDKWTVSSSTVTVAGGTKFVPKAIGTGYVADYQLVVKFDGLAVIPFGAYRLSIGSPVMTGRLVPLDATMSPIDVATNPSKADIAAWRVEDGVIAGRLPINDMLAAMGTLVAPGSDAGAGSHLCSSVSFALLKGELCARLDVNAAASLDFQRDLACDALSTGITFRADPAKVGQVIAPLDDGGTNECYPTEDGGGPVGGGPVSYRCP